MTCSHTLKILLLGAALPAALSLVAPPEASAEFISSTKTVPTGRLLANMKAWIEKHPDDAYCHYAFARIHAMLYAREANELHLQPPAKNAEGRPSYGFAPWESVLVKRARIPLTDAMKAHLIASIRHYRRAGTLDDNHALAHLGHGWMLENAALFAVKLDEPPGVTEEKLDAETREKFARLIANLGAEDFETREKAEAALIALLPRAIPHLIDARKGDDVEVEMRCNRILARAWLDAALPPYRKAFALAVDVDRKKEYFGPHADSGVAFEAGKALVRILGNRPCAEKEQEELARVTKEVAGFKKKRRAITPVIFPLHGEAPLAELLDPARIVSFDLDGDDRPGLWSWVRPDAGILVWDPENTGEISSGRQLFGSVTWWIAWRNGYEPLAALDDDHDGRLAGEELHGIAVWTDRDSDGVSDPGEVVPARDAGIESIAVREITTLTGVPAHPRGIRMRDGSTRPTYDWVVEPPTGR